jgi:hypothetical protein
MASAASFSEKNCSTAVSRRSKKSLQTLASVRGGGARRGAVVRGCVTRFHNRARAEDAQISPRPSFSACKYVDKHRMIWLSTVASPYLLQACGSAGGAGGRGRRELGDFGGSVRSAPRASVPHHVEDPSEVLLVVLEDV